MFILSTIIVALTNVVINNGIHETRVQLFQNENRWNSVTVRFMTIFMLLVFFKPSLQLTFWTDLVYGKIDNSDNETFVNRSEFTLINESEINDGNFSKSILKFSLNYLKYRHSYRYLLKSYQIVIFYESVSF